MALTRIQKTFIKLATSQWVPLGKYPAKRYRSNKKLINKKVRIEIIDAVTGQKTSAKGFEESRLKLRKWLKMRNVRAEFTDVFIKKGSAWYKLTNEEFIDYPIIVKVGTYKSPYLVKRVQDRKTIKGRTTLSLQLETTNNIDYLGILSDKKELLAKKKGSK